MSNPKAKEAEANMEEGLSRKELNGELKMPSLPKSLNLEEKKYLLAVERGDLASVKKIIQKTHRHHHVDLNCMDPLGRGALLISIEGENLQMVELLVVMGVDTRDALLHAIDKEFVEAVELLLEHEELIHKEGEPYSWEKLDRTLASFTSDITPLILAAHRNNYEILKILLDRGATLPMPHDVRCGCPDCIRGVQDDSLRHSMSRINAYRALASPSLIALSSTDPILTAFELSLELKSLAYTENEFRQEYIELRRQCQEFAVELLSHTRSSQELAILLNHDPNSPPYEEGEHMKLARLELAIDYKQKKFVAHPSVQQLLGQIWYEGLPGFKRKTLAQKCMDIARVAILFPFYCCLYMFAPNTQTGNLMRKPFMKFLMHASSYLFFLLLLILVSQRFEVLVIQFFGTESMQKALTDQLLRQRGNGPTFLEGVVALYVLGYIFEDGKEMWKEGIQNYFRNMWNFIDMSRNFAYSMVVILRLIAYVQQQAEITKNPSTAYIPREEWDAFDPQLIAEGIFAMANIFSALKLVHLFSINPYLGPLQISLGRMVIDIVKFFFIYSLVLFAFACGLNQLLWYFSDLERQKCFTLPGGLPDWNKNPDACLKWRRFANLFESSQSLFWASFGLMDLTTFELTGIKTYTRFWGLLMFGSYSVINVVVLLNLLIAMMSNSYAIITEHSDTEWKFARSKLWLSYFEEGGTLPPPFNLFPTPKDFMKWCGIREKDKIRRVSSKRRQSHVQERDYRYAAVMRALVWRYIIAMHRKDEMSEVTEDDVNEVKGDISTLRFELLEVFKMNGMDISCAAKNAKTTLGRRMRVWERRLLRDFHVVSVAGEGDTEPISPLGDGDENNPADKFRKLAMMVVKSNASPPTSASGGSGKCIRTMSQIGRSLSSDSFKSTQNLRKAMDEANRLKVMEPTPGSSPRDSPMPLLQDSGSSALELLQHIVEEEREEQEGDGNSLFDFENNTINQPIAQWKLPNPDSKKDQGKDKAIGKLQKSAAPLPIAPTQLTTTTKDSNTGTKIKALVPTTKSCSEPTPDSGKTGDEPKPADLTKNTAETEKMTSQSSTQKTADSKVPCPAKQVSESDLAATSGKDSFPSASLNPKPVNLTGPAARSGEDVACTELSKTGQGEIPSAQKAAPPNSFQDTTSTSVTVTNETSNSRNGTKRRGSVPMVTMDKNDLTVPPPTESITVATDNLPKDSKIAIDDKPVLPHQKSKLAPLKPFTSFPSQETSTSASNPGTPSCTSASNPGTPSCFSKSLESSEKTATTPAPELLLQVSQQPTSAGQLLTTPGNEQEQVSAAPAIKRVADVKTIKRENKGWI